MFRIDRLGEIDVPAALRLSAQAGWNQIEADWVRLVRLWPEYCVAGWVDGEVVATGTLAVYRGEGAAVGWVGMILVGESQRRRGYAGAVLDAIIAAAERGGVSLLGLDATELGRPVYAARGFAEHSGMERLLRPAGAGVGEFGLARGLREWDWAGVESLDRRATGVDRSQLLRQLSGEPGARCRVVASDAGVSAFGFLRRGRAAYHLGPLVAEHPDLADDLCNCLLAEATDGPVLIDVPRPNPVACVLAAAGFSAVRQLARMTRPASAAPVLAGPLVFAASSFELG
jgi:GNAT superfamily N-acetyltransferase